MTALTPSEERAALRAANDYAVQQGYCTPIAHLVAALPPHEMARLFAVMAADEADRAAAHASRT